MYIKSFSRALPAVVALALCSVQAAEDYSTWPSYKNVAINTKATGANVGTNVLNYPVLVRLDSTSADVFTGAGTNGATLRFSKASGAPRPYQIESWDATAKKAAIWVLADTVKGNDSITTLRMYWGKAGAVDSSKAAAVFDTANGYKAVFHMNEASGNIGNSTIDTITGVNTGTTAAPGIAGSARNFAGSNAENGSATTSTRQYIDLGNPAVLGAITGRITFSTWIRWLNVAPTVTTGSSHYRNIIQREGSSPSMETFLRIGHTSGNQNQSQYATGKYASPDIFAQSPQLASAYSDSAQWVNLAGTYDSSASTPAGGLWRLYRNGVLIASDPYTGTTARGVTAGATKWWIGRTTGQNNRYFSGDIDELRIANVTRDSNFLKLDYHVQKAGTTVVGLGSTQSTSNVPSNLVYAVQAGSYSTGNGIPPNVPAYSGAVDSFTVAPALPAGLLLNKASGVISGRPTAVSAAANFVITATNAFGSAKDTISITVVASSADAAYGTWANHKFLTVNTRTAGALQSLRKFPLLVRLDSTNFSAGFGQAAYGGSDLRFTKVGDAVRLPHQIDSWDATAKRAAIWVLLDSVRGDNVTNIRMHWGKAGVADSSNGAKVFEASNGFGAVYHMNEASGDVLDATANGNTGTNLRTTATAGMIGGGRNFGGPNSDNNAGASATAQYITLGNPASLDLGTGRLTLEAWVRWTRIRPTAGSTYWRNIIMRISGGDELHLRIDGNSPYQYRTGAYLSSTDYGPLSPNPAASYGDSAQWVHLVGVYDSANASGNIWRLYRNGVMLAETSAGDPGPTGTGDWVLGAFATTANRRYFVGDMDEIRISRTHRSASWVKLSYETQKAAPVGVTLGDTETPPLALGNSPVQAGGLSFSSQRLNQGILFQVRGAGNAAVRLTVLDMRGREVWTRLERGAGDRSVVWNGSNRAGAAAPSGIYAVRASLVDAEGRVTATLEQKVPLMR
jgi:hypothetical protein